MSALGWLVVAFAASASVADEQQLGPVRIAATLTPEQPTLGDEITLEIRVQAEAGVEVLMPEFGEALDRYTILDFVPQQTIGDDGSTTYVQRYTLQPYLSGSQSIPSILVEFVDNRPGQQPAPEGLDAYEVLTEPLEFDVKSVIPSEAAAELKPPLAELPLPSEPVVTRTRWLIGLSVVLLGSAVLFAAWWNKHRQHVIRKNAYEIARGRLDALLEQPLPTTPEQIEVYFVTISGIVRQYLENRFDVRAPELTTDEFLVLAASASDLTPGHQSLLRDFLRRADLVKFAGVKATRAEMEHSADVAGRFLEETRENAPLIEVSSGPHNRPDAGSDPRAEDRVHV